jgi:UDP-3-O-acyl N-acetylglucosamine deacetylase
LVFTAVNREVGFLDDPDFPAEFRQLCEGTVVCAPPLRERREDIPLLAGHFLGEACREFEREPAALDETAITRLIEYPWPGNVKELKILMEHVAMTGPGPLISANDLLLPGAMETGPAAGAPSAPSRSGTPSTKKKTFSSQFHASRAYHDARPDLRRQRTLKANAVMYGQGLHTGVKTGLTLSPLPPGSGVVFGHITSAEAVPAVISHVESTEYATCLGKDGAVARTIEHLMAVFHIYGLTNVLVKISGEVPIMDGSALEFCKLVETAEIIPQDEFIEAARVTKAIELPLDPKTSKFMRVAPADHFEIEYFMEYPQPIGAMHIVYRCDGPEDFKKWIAPARTFGFVRDMKMMDEMGLAGGGRLSNVVLVDDERVVNPPLRFPDEFVRHKVLDIIGDFYLLGRPFLGKITARQTGHSENIAMLKLINDMLRLIE